MIAWWEVHAITFADSRSHKENAAAGSDPMCLFEFADPQLEALSSGQKLAAEKWGNEHSSRVKQY